MWLFNTKTYTFTQQAFGGDVPPPHKWYDVSTHRSSDRACVAYGSIHQPEAEELPSDLWTFNVLADQWRCENFMSELWDLDVDLQ